MKKEGEKPLNSNDLVPIGVVTSGGMKRKWEVQRRMVKKFGFLNPSLKIQKKKKIQKQKEFKKVKLSQKILTEKNLNINPICPQIPAFF